MNNYIVLKTVSEDIETNIIVDNSHSFRDFNINQANVQKTNELVPPSKNLFIQIDWEADEITINNVKLSGVVKDLFIQFINQRK